MTHPIKITGMTAQRIACFLEPTILLFGGVPLFLLTDQCKSLG